MRPFERHTRPSVPARSLAMRHYLRVCTSLIALHGEHRAGWPAKVYRSRPWDNSRVSSGHFRPGSAGVCNNGSIRLQQKESCSFWAAVPRMRPLGSDLSSSSHAITRRLLAGASKNASPQGCLPRAGAPRPAPAGRRRHSRSRSPGNERYRGSQTQNLSTLSGGEGRESNPPGTLRSPDWF